MRKIDTKSTFLAMCLMLGGGNLAICQTPAFVDSAFVNQAFQHTVALYHQAIGNQAIIYNGPQYVAYPFKFETGHPYFFEDKTHPGSIVYEQVAFPNLQLKYNQITDVVILVQNSRMIQLASSQISAFTVANHQFIKIETDSNSTAINIPKSGFYEVLYQQKTAVYKREEKKIKEDVRLPPEGVVRSIYSSIDYYLFRNNQYFKIRNKRSLLKALADSRQAVDKYMRSNKLRFKTDPDQTLLAVAAYYDTIKP